MKKWYLLGLALFGVLALVAASATSASAVEILVESKAVSETAAETEGEVVLKAYESSTSTTLLAEIDCSGILKGLLFLDADGKLLLLIEDVLNLEESEIGTLGDPNEGAFLSCTNLIDPGSLTDCQANSLVKVWPTGINLELKEDWEFELLELSAGDWSGILPGTAGYHTECTTLLGVTGENLCEGGQELLLENTAGTTPVSLKGIFVPFAHTTERANCSLTGEHTAEATGEGNTWAIGTTALSHLATAFN